MKGHVITFFYLFCSHFSSVSSSLQSFLSCNLCCKSRMSSSLFCVHYFFFFLRGFLQGYPLHAFYHHSLLSSSLLTSVETYQSLALSRHISRFRISSRRSFVLTASWSLFLLSSLFFLVVVVGTHLLIRVFSSVLPLFHVAFFLDHSVVHTVSHSSFFLFFRSFLHSSLILLPYNLCRNAFTPSFLWLCLALVSYICFPGPSFLHILFPHLLEFVSFYYYCTQDLICPFVFFCLFASFYIFVTVHFLSHLSFFYIYLSLYIFRHSFIIVVCRNSFVPWYRFLFLSVFLYIFVTALFLSICLFLYNFFFIYISSLLYY